jgi:hypothetical protein
MALTQLGHSRHRRHYLQHGEIIPALGNRNAGTNDYMSVIVIRLLLGRNRVDACARGQSCMRFRKSQRLIRCLFRSCLCRSDPREYHSQQLQYVHPLDSPLTVGSPSFRLVCLELAIQREFNRHF